MRVVGRDAELAAVEAFLAGAPSGPRALLLEGVAGMGKTTVWLEGVAAARAQGLLVLESRAAQAESALGFGAVIDLLAPVAGDVLPELPPPQRAALAVALLLEDADGPAPQQKDVSVAVLGALRLLTRRGPVLVALDDVQWLDAASAQVLAYALRRVRDEPVGVLASRRSGEPTAFALEALRPDAELTRIELAGLSLGSLHHLVRDRLGVSLDRPALSRLTKASGGNPFFALEIVRQAERRPDAELPVPRGLRELVAERLAGLEPAAREAV
ncbi:MAG TPA: ATP-binding protein, partial [Gaiellaceae bacterium]|nr:ATP-binding protein [Gaiellaceae bacterium]